MKTKRSDGPSVVDRQSQKWLSYLYRELKFYVFTFSCKLLSLTPIPSAFEWTVVQHPLRHVDESLRHRARRIPRIKTETWQRIVVLSQHAGAIARDLILFPSFAVQLMAQLLEGFVDCFIPPIGEDDMSFSLMASTYRLSPAQRMYTAPLVGSARLRRYLAVYSVRAVTLWTSSITVAAKWALDGTAATVGLDLGNLDIAKTRLNSIFETWFMIPKPHSADEVHTFLTWALEFATMGNLSSPSDGVSRLARVKPVRYLVMALPLAWRLRPPAIPEAAETASCPSSAAEEDLPPSIVAEADVYLEVPFATPDVLSGDSPTNGTPEQEVDSSENEDKSWEHDAMHAPIRSFSARSINFHPRPKRMTENSIPTTVLPPHLNPFRTPSFTEPSGSPTGPPVFGRMASHTYGANGPKSPLLKGRGSRRSSKRA